MLLFHATRHPAEYALASICALLCCGRLLSFTRGFQSTGVFLRMMFRVLQRAAPFLLVLMVVIVGFSIAFLCTYRAQTPGFENSGFALLSAYMLMFGEMSVETDMHGAFVDSASTAPNATGAVLRLENHHFVDLYILQFVYFVMYLFVVVSQLLSTSLMRTVHLHVTYLFLSRPTRLSYCLMS
jgi:hypothetical protein